ncbi:hypothetical protein F5Y18DRAFT_344175 [Xylariaceae sp. FL1019]|nr:hypothetical protein F5Y18DRAFT_344175 [Xylariaceae sp. FL1019]
MASYNGGNPQPGGPDQDHYQSMFARLQAAQAAQQQQQQQHHHHQSHQGHQSHGEDSPALASNAHDLLARFHSFNQEDNPHDYYGQHSNAESPVTGLDDYPPPAAPTPPSGFGHSHHPPHGLSGLGPIGAMPSTNAPSKAEQSNSLLNLLKFNNTVGQPHQPHQSQISQPHSHDSPSGSAHGGSAHGGSARGLTFPSGNSGSSNLHSSHASNPPPIHAPVPMPADPQGLLATLMKGNMHNEASASRPDQQHHQQHQQQQQQPPQQITMPPSWNVGPPVNTQEYLLNLLHRPKPAQNDQPSTNESSQPATLTPQSNNRSSADYHGEYSHKQIMPGNASHDSTPLPHSYAQSPPTNYNYHSPPSQHVDQIEYQRDAEYSREEDYSRDKDYSPDENYSPKDKYPEEEEEDVYSRRKDYDGEGHYQEKEYQEKDYRDKEYSGEDEYVHEKNTETVSEAMNDLAQKADQEAQEALARAEQEEVQAQIAADLEDMMSARTDAEFQESAEVAARDIKRELDREENADALEDQYSPSVAQAIREIVEDAAMGPVVDSWESAEADEIIVIEEPIQPVKVYNFPMKPWISITMLDSFDEPRPQFRDDVILDIARLKKEFDQIDRNLVSATEAYMVYGMSKAGGVRVIRQEDGKDAKLFTDTKDRVFNVAVSYASDDGPPEESLIGTGISGTVYYVQIRGGGKDHIEESNPEQAGFALPPASSQEGDAPGGVLKTRARTSSTHPEYFAVGRGKTINIIWPAVIMQKNIFKSGPDRVVDTERLAHECSLRINTGKAGKDFTFSQDDSTIVSLDKAGRVKFWDVRELTAIDGDSDLRFPMPAHMSLEVKEPMMTLNTTPEGEKAWPTSVLLLDKQRPYQKRCALRYMIVGMKQNHTLQLWDLALGKPVQEFNLPHSKESDAVCSVSYHPPTGIIVVGHPTRNSVYFLHLSAPKYNIKGLTQVDYIQKLMAKDPSIPEPDSTAVISGVREYSFANKGLLRSLYLLTNPSCSSSCDETSLFDLYAMHSKGVTAVTVKQSDLGWTQDNKVISGVDAADAGLVQISKLKELPNPLVLDPHPSAPDELVPPMKIATRSSVKDTPPPQVTAHLSAQDANKKGADTNGHAQGQSDRKEIDVPQTPFNQLDKSEKKARKKREKAAAAAAAAEKLANENSQSNGISQPSRADLTKSTASPMPAMSSESTQQGFKQMQSALTEKLGAIISNELKDHRVKIETEFRNRENTFAKSQKELLELVQQVLNDNTQAVLSRTIADQFEDTVVPHITSVITKTIETQIDSKIGGKVSHSIQNQMQKSLPNAVSQALQKADLIKSIPEKLASSVAVDMEQSFRDVLVNTITPIFGDMATAASHSMLAEVQRRNTEQMEEFERRHVADTRKIDQLTALVVKLSDTVGNMASSQAQIQDQLHKMQRRAPQERAPAQHQHQYQHQHQPTQSVPSHAPSYASPSATSSNAGNQIVPYSHSNQSSNPKDVELGRTISHVASLLEHGQYEPALIQWVQSNRRQEIFDQYIAKEFPLGKMNEMSALVSLSSASVVVEHFDGPMLVQRVNWVEAVLENLYQSLPDVNVRPRIPIEKFFECEPRTDSLQDPQLRDVIPGIMGTFYNKIEALLVRINSHSPNDPNLPRLSIMMRKAGKIRDFATPRPAPGY